MFILVSLSGKTERLGVERFLEKGMRFLGASASSPCRPLAWDQTYFRCRSCRTWQRRVLGPLGLPSKSDPRCLGSPVVFLLGKDEPRPIASELRVVAGHNKLRPGNSGGLLSPKRGTGTPRLFFGCLPSGQKLLS